ncbi:hypothetical protein [Oxynema aestuarii]|uniref:Uncharacterized protein n=1 Tax=Oxynema aestuarii AP17 TaxID=2064643 RepID=A0A6H1TWT5_9CYAN|nr:hypothetical protein [Oxynema aestuarii]QIZ69799.1 hypothetical protein HCG48_03735 [Oxynema aestuarii AP17]
MNPKTALPRLEPFDLQSRSPTQDRRDRFATTRAYRDRSLTSVNFNS